VRFFVPVCVLVRIYFVVRVAVGVLLGMVQCVLQCDCFFPVRVTVGVLQGVLQCVLRWCCCVSAIFFPVCVAECVTVCVAVSVLQWVWPRVGLMLERCSLQRRV